MNFHHGPVRATDASRGANRAEGDGIMAFTIKVNGRAHRVDVEPPGGMGETGTSAIVPAIANAIFAATGKRLRKMPVDASVLRQPA
jgi:hypothetical protein